MDKQLVRIPCMRRAAVSTATDTKNKNFFK